MLRNIDGSFAAINAAHDLDSADNNVMVVRGRHWMISSQFSTGSMESIVWALAMRWESQGFIYRECGFGAPDKSIEMGRNRKACVLLKRSSTHRGTVLTAPCLNDRSRAAAIFFPIVAARPGVLRISRRRNLSDQRDCDPSKLCPVSAVEGHSRVKLSISSHATCGWMPYAKSIHSFTPWVV